jgi:hypothetical protein
MDKSGQTKSKMVNNYKNTKLERQLTKIMSKDECNDIFKDVKE